MGEEVGVRKTDWNVEQNPTDLHARDPPESGLVQSSRLLSQDMGSSGLIYKFPFQVVNAQALGSLSSLGNLIFRSKPVFPTSQPSLPFGVWVLARHGCWA